MPETFHELDRGARYRVAGWPAIAVYIAGPVETETEVAYPGPCGFCDEGDEWCPNCGGTGETTYYDTETTEDPTRATVVMVGDDRPETVDVADLEPLAGPVCECGQIGCAWHGMGDDDDDDKARR